jgi:hypothetical protein
VCCVCCASCRWRCVVFVVRFVGSGICEGLITDLGSPMVVMCLNVCDLEALTVGWPGPDMGCCAKK